MLRAVRRARRRPRPPRQEGPARLPAVAGRREPGEPTLGRRRSAAAGPAGTSSARRSPWTTSAWRFDVQGGGSRPGLPAPRDGRLRTRRCSPASARSPRRTCTPAWSASTARRCRSPRATWSSSPRCAQDGVDPMAIRLALLAPPLPRRLGVDRRRSWRTAEARLGRWRARRLAGPTGRRPTALVDGGPRARSPTTWTPRAALAAVDRWAAPAGDGRHRHGAPGVVSRAVDALLGVAL